MTYSAGGEPFLASRSASCWWRMRNPIWEPWSCNQVDLLETWCQARWMVESCWFPIFDRRIVSSKTSNVLNHFFYWNVFSLECEKLWDYCADRARLRSEPQDEKGLLLLKIRSASLSGPQKHQELHFRKVPKDMTQASPSGWDVKLCETLWNLWMKSTSGLGTSGMTKYLGGPY